MTDLVETLCDIMAPGDDWPGHKLVAKKAIAAVYDDLAEPSEAMVREGKEAEGVHRSTVYGSTETQRPCWQAMLAAKRKEALGDE